MHSTEDLKKIESRLRELRISYCSRSLLEKQGVIAVFRNEVMARIFAKYVGETYDLEEKGVEDLTVDLEPNSMEQLEKLTRQLIREVLGEEAYEPIWEQGLTDETVEKVLLNT